MQHTTWRKGIYMHWSCSCTQCIGYNVLSAAGNVRDSHHGSLSPIMLAEQAWQPKLGLHWIRWPGCEKDRSLSLYSNVDLDTWLSRSHDISRASCFPIRQRLRAPQVRWISWKIHAPQVRQAEKNEGMSLQTEYHVAMSAMSQSCLITYIIKLSAAFKMSANQQSEICFLTW